MKHDVLEQRKYEPECGQLLAAVRDAKLDGAVWVYPKYNHYSLVAVDGEVLAEVIGAYPKGTYTVGGKKYWGLDEAKTAARRGVTGS